ncbi:MAG: DUF5591 domain-containing protein [Candidatus Thermoplasmatota archaeon]
MLEVSAFDGRARAALWQPKDGKDGPSLRTPGLLFPETTLAPVPSWATATVTSKPTNQPGRIELVSGGTWFYPLHEDQAGLRIPPIQPAPSTVVQVVDVGSELAVFHDALGWATNPQSMAKAIAEARTKATPGRLLWAPGLGAPDDYALWAYLGVDLFDASPLLLAATRGTALTTDGPMPAAEMQALHGGSWDLDRLVAFNLETARAELALVAHHITKGTLRFLVERRVYARSGSVELLRRLDREHNYLEAATPRHRAVALPAMTAEALTMPEVEAFRRSVRDRYSPPRTAKVLVLLPCSQRKPYKTSRSHRAFARVLDDSGIRGHLHEVMVTSPLGLVPRELEEVYPANQYDIPVTGHWMRDEEALVREQLAALLSKHDYTHVVVHTGQATFDVMRDLLPEQVRHTCLHHPTSKEDLARLAEELARLKPLVGAQDARAAGRDRRMEDMRSLLTFQFGPAIAADLTDGAYAQGRMPYVKLMRDDVQLGQTTPDRGVLSLTIDGARILAKHGVKRVFIQDFKPKATSTLFAVGVDGADPDVRAGDEVVVVHKDDVRGCGVAQMDGPSMTHLKRGSAVTLRHVVASAKDSKPASKSQEVVA